MYKQCIWPYWMFLDNMGSYSEYLSKIDLKKWQKSIVPSFGWFIHTVVRSNWYDCEGSLLRIRCTIANYYHFEHLSLQHPHQHITSHTLINNYHHIFNILYQQFISLFQKGNHSFHISLLSSLSTCYNNHIYQLIQPNIHYPNRNIT